MNKNEEVESNTSYLLEQRIKLILFIGKNTPN